MEVVTGCGMLLGWGIREENVVSRGIGDEGMDSETGRGGGAGNMGATICHRVCVRG